MLELTAADVRERFATFAGQKCSIQQSGGNIVDAEVHIMRNKHFPHHGTGISLDPEYLVTGSNSGHQALNAGLLAGGRVGILLGIDGKPAPEGEPSHFHGDHPIKDNATVYPSMVKAFRAGAKAIAAMGMQVVNCNPDSAVDCFEKMPLAEALQL